ncbi:hypothetical protein FACS1894132_03590 [Clostridia bacterium]|nr:hypothetical protein FACS1894132_03590 [Clostridia bacterium]
MNSSGGFDYNAYADSHPGAYVSIGDNTVFPDLQSIIDSHNAANTPSIKTFSAGINSESNPIGAVSASNPFAFSRVISGAGEYDKNNSDNTWEKSIGKFDLPDTGYTFIDIRGFYYDKLVGDKVQCGGFSKITTRGATFAVGIVSGSVTDWGPDCKVKENTANLPVSLTKKNHIG